MLGVIIKKIDRLIEKVESLGFSLWQIMLIFYLASFFRGVLEVFVSTQNFGRITNPIDLFFHYPLWFIGVFLSAIVIICFFTKEGVKKISSIVAVFSFVILIPIIVDLLAGSGNAIEYVFVTGSFGGLVKSFFSFFGATDSGFSGATIGFRAEGLFVIVALIFFVFYKTKSILRALSAFFALYLVVFLFAAAPSLLHSGFNFFTGNNLEIGSKATQDFFLISEPANSKTINRTFLSDVKEKSLPLPTSIKGPTSFTLSFFFLLVDVLLGAIIFYFYDKKKFWAAIKNARFLRVIYYYSFVFIGFFLGVSFAERFFINSIFDLASVLAVLLSGTFAGLFSVWENDEVDLEIDKVSNNESIARPLASGVFSLSEWRNLKYLFLFISLNFAFLCGFYQLVFVLLFVGIYHIYSAPPLRLKRFLGLSSLLIAVNALIAVWMGFFVSSGTENFGDFPKNYLLGAVLIIFLVENVKNIKDIEGDRKNGIKTLPVVLGEKVGKLVIGAMSFFAVLLVPILFFMNTYTFFTAVFFGVVLFLLITKERFNEKYIFISYFIFAIIIACEELIRIYGLTKI